LVPCSRWLRAHDYNEALALPSDHDYGNGVAIFTRDGDAARDFAAKVNVGMVGINVPIPVPIAYYTFGGWKKSGFGDLNQHGPDSIRFYTKTKTINLALAVRREGGCGVLDPDDELTRAWSQVDRFPPTDLILRSALLRASRRMAACMVVACGHPSRRIATRCSSG